jgi:hypothetical protein
MRGAPPPPDQDRRGLSDDYLVEADEAQAGMPIALQLVRLARAVLLVVLAALSLALFWLVGTMIGVL